MIKKREAQEYPRDLRNSSSELLVSQRLLRINQLRKKNLKTIKTQRKSKKKNPSVTMKPPTPSPKPKIRNPPTTPPAPKTP